MAPLGFASSQNETETALRGSSTPSATDLAGLGQSQCGEGRAGQMEHEQTVDYLGTMDSITLERRPTGKRSKSDITTRALLAMVVAQGDQCALSGRVLTPETASMDHKHPIAKGGMHELANVWVVDRRVNQAKGAMEPGEFIQMCREVVAWQDRVAAQGERP